MNSLKKGYYDSQYCSVCSGTGESRYAEPGTGRCYACRGTGEEQVWIEDSGPNQDDPSEDESWTDEAANDSIQQPNPPTIPDRSPGRDSDRLPGSTSGTDPNHQTI